MMDGSKAQASRVGMDDGSVGAMLALDEIGERLASSIGRIDDLTHRVRCLGDRLMGEDPEDPKSLGISEAGGVVGELDARLTGLKGLIDTLDQQICRLERL